MSRYNASVTRARAFAGLDPVLEHTGASSDRRRPSVRKKYLLIKERNSGKTEFQLPKATERISKEKKERGKKTAETGKKHNPARRGFGTVSG
jgi:hypothetical protein